MSKMIDNKVSVSERATKKESGITGKNYDEFFQNKLQLSADLEAELRSKGLSWRFINATEYRKNHGHRSHWKPYKSEAKGSAADMFGTDKDGHIIRGDCILATRSNEMTSRHKEFLKKRTDIQSNYQKQKAQELRKDAQEAGIKTVVTEGYEEGSEEND